MRRMLISCMQNTDLKHETAFFGLHLVRTFEYNYIKNFVHSVSIEYISCKIDIWNNMCSPITEMTYYGDQRICAVRIFYEHQISKF